MRTDRSLYRTLSWFAATTLAAAAFASPPRSTTSQRAASGTNGPDVRLAMATAGHARSAGQSQRRAWLGVQLAPLSRAQRERIGAGLRITRVIEDSPADRAGLEPSEIIVAVNGTRIGRLDDLRAAFRALRPGDQARLTIRRGSKLHTARVRMSERPGIRVRRRRHDDQARRSERAPETDVGTEINQAIRELREGFEREKTRQEAPADMRGAVRGLEAGLEQLLQMRLQMYKQAENNPSAALMIASQMMPLVAELREAIPAAGEQTSLRGAMWPLPFASGTFGAGCACGHGCCGARASFPWSGLTTGYLGSPEQILQQMKSWVPAPFRFDRSTTKR